MKKEFNNLDGDINIDSIIKAYKKAIKLVPISQKNKTVNIPVNYSLSAFDAYQGAITNTGDFRKSFCIMVFRIIDNNKKFVDNKEIINITVNDIEGLSDKDLEIIMNAIINSSPYLKEFESMLGKKYDNIFEKFNSIYELENEKYQIELKKLTHQLKSKFDKINKYSGLLTNLDISTKIKNLSNITSTTNPDIESLTYKMKMMTEQTMHNHKLMRNSVSNLASQMTFASNLVRKPVKDFYSKLDSTRKILLPESIDYLKSMIDAQKTIGQVINENYTRHQQVFVKNLNHILNFKNFNNSSIDFPVFHQEIANKLKPFIYGMQERLFIRTNISDSFERKSKTMLQFGWWFIGSISIDIINYIYKNKDTLSEQDVNKIINDYYTLNNFYELDKIVNKWSESLCFKVWMQKVDDAISAHKHEKYSLSIPIWAMMLEGIIRDFMRTIYGISSFRFGPLYNSFKEKVEELDAFLINHVFYCMDSFYISFDPNKPDETDDFNRHKILHGLAQGYDLPIYSLKLILYLDEIFYIISSLELENNIAVS